MNLTPAARRRWLIGVLIVSLAFNAFVVGATVTDFIHIRWPFVEKARQPAQLRFELAWLRGRLPPEAMDKVETAVAAAKPATVAHIQKLRDLRHELGMLLAAPEPDRGAVDAKLAEIRAELSAMQAEVQAASTAALLSLPPETRAALAGAKADNP